LLILTLLLGVSFAGGTAPSGGLACVTESSERADTQRVTEMQALEDKQERADTLERAVVVSQRDAEASNTAPLQTLSHKAIERSGAAGLHEVLRSFAGVSIRDYGGIGGVKTVSVRNLGAQHTAVSYDGITVSDAQNGQIDLSRFNLENVSEVAVEISAADDIFRSARLLNSAGVLSINTLHPIFDAKPYKVSASMRYGSFSTYNPSITYSQKLGKRWSTSVSMDWLKSDGVYPFTLVNGSLRTKEKRLNSDVNTLGAEINIYGGIGLGDLQVKTRGYLSERGLPGSVIYYSQNPTERLWDKDLALSAIYTTPLGEQTRIRQTLSASRAYNRYTNTSALYQVPEDDRYTQYEAASSTIFEYKPLARLRFTVAEDIFYNHLNSTIPESQTPSRITSVSAVSGQYRSPRLTLTGSLSCTAAHEWVETGTPAPDRSRLSPSLSTSWSASKALRLRASWRDGFRIPTFNDLYYARVGNTALSPEKASQFNLGATLSLGPSANPGSGYGKEVSNEKRGKTVPGRLTLTADIYYNSVRDKIVAIPTMFIWKMRNLGKVQMFGGDFTASYAQGLGTGWTLNLRANYSYRYAVDITDPTAKNYRHQIQYTPRHSGNAILTLQTPWLDFSYTLNVVGKRYFLQQNIPANEMAAYQDHAVSLSREFNANSVKFRLSAEVLNLTGDNYEVIRYYPMPGRNFRIKMKVSF
jgi:vitamin B12 transporter